MQARGIQQQKDFAVKVAVLIPGRKILQVKIFNSVNARLATEPNPQFATITIVGINDTPEPRYIKNMTAIIGAVCGAATAVPCALLLARFIRSLRRGNGTCLYIRFKIAQTHVFVFWRSEACLRRGRLAVACSGAVPAFMERRCECRAVRCVA